MMLLMNILYDTYEVMLNEWAQTFVTYYTYNGDSWNGVESLGRLVDLQQSGVVLSDLNGQILYHYDVSYIGSRCHRKFTAGAIFCGWIIR